MSVSHTLVAERYRLLEPLGAGGMGRVWLARDEVLRRDVAIKEVVPPEGLTETEREELQRRTLREARAAARLNHPNVVRIYDVVQTERRPWIVMEHVPSRSLHQVVNDDGPLAPEHAGAIGLAVLSALRAAHAAGVMHRDVKPGNVLLASDGRVVLTDFGLATFEGGDGTVTRPGLILGSPQYISPERAREGTAGPASDLWSLGATLYAAVEGHAPYARATTWATLTALATEDPDPMHRAGVLKPVIGALLRKDPNVRATADEVERMLRRVVAREGRSRSGIGRLLPRQRRPREDGSGGILGGVFGGGGVFGSGGIFGSGNSVGGAGSGSGAGGSAAGGPDSGAPGSGAPDSGGPGSGGAGGRPAVAAPAGPVPPESFSGTAPVAAASLADPGTVVAASGEPAADPAVADPSTTAPGASSTSTSTGLAAASAAPAAAVTATTAAAASSGSPTSALGGGGSPLSALAGDPSSTSLIETPGAESPGATAVDAESPGATAVDAESSGATAVTETPMTETSLERPPVGGAPPPGARSPVDEPVDDVGPRETETEAAETEAAETEAVETEAAETEAAETEAAEIGPAEAEAGEIEPDDTRVDETVVTGSQVDETEVDGTQVDGTRVYGAPIDGLTPVSPAPGAVGGSGTAVDRPVAAGTAAGAVAAGSVMANPVGTGSGSTATGRAAVPEPVATPAPERRRRRLIAALAGLVVLVVLIVLATRLDLGGKEPLDNAGGAAPSATALSANPPSTPSAEASPTPGAVPTTPPPTTPAVTPPADAGQPPTLALPPGWHWYTDPTAGWRVAVPDGWVVDPDESYPSMVYFREQTAPRRLLGIDRADQPKMNPVADWTEQEADRRGRYSGYQRVRIESVPYWTVAADWEYTYNGSGGRLHVINRGFVTSPTQAHAIYWSTPESQWAENLANFNLIAASFAPAPGS